MSTSPALAAMLKRGAPGSGLDEFQQDLDRLDEESLVQQTLAGYQLQKFPDSPAFEDFARRYAFRAYAVRGDGAARRLILLAPKIECDGGEVVQCIQQAGARALLCLHTSGALYESGGRLVPGRALTPLAGSLAQFLEWEAALDALADEGRRWFRLSLRVPEGTTRVLAERLSLSPVEGAIDRGLGAWRRSGFLLRARRSAAVDPPWILDACAAQDSPGADEFSSACMELLEKSPSRQLWNPG